jgi:hypothetical protein
MSTIKLRLFFLFLITGMVSIPTVQAQGLRFYGNKESIEKRTTFSIFDEGSVPVFTQYIDLSFELKILDFGSFGYLLHIVDPQSNVAYSFTYTYIDQLSSAFKFNTEGKANLISMNFTNESLKSKWIPIQLHIDLTTGESFLAVDHKTKKSISKLKTSAELQPLIVFGRRENLVDVSSFAIRNLKISGAKHSFNFSLNESTGEEVHDIHGKTRGKVINPYWLLNDSYHWKKVLTIPSKSIMGSKFNEKEQCILFINQDSLFRYDVGTKQLFCKEYANKLPFKMLLGTNFVDEKSNKIYAYEINNLPDGSITIAALDVPTRTWKPIGKAHTPVQLHHHNGFLNKNNQYLVFGGFGNRSYSNSFLSYHSVSDRWDTLQFKGENISHRFFSSMASSKQGNYLYIFGGVGNDSGDQSVGHNYYDDLYRVDLINRTIKKCWDNHSNQKLVSGERMILAADEKFLFVIRYAEYNENTYLKLYRIAVADGTTQLLGDSIPFISKSIASNVSLYYNSALQEFYCVTQEFEDGTQTVNAHVYTLSAPAVTKAALHFYSPPKTNTKNTLLIVLFFAFFISCTLFFYWRNRKSKIASKTKPESAPDQTIPTISSAYSKSSVTGSDVSERESVSKTEYNKIYLFGIFTVYGKSGRDITYLFSNKLKQIFLYILLNSDKEGVSSTLLNSLFWPEKMDKKAKNLKGVTISNLRKVLAEIDGVELVYERGFFRIVIIEPCYCDYFHLNTLITNDTRVSYDILQILERGQIFECTNQGLFDKYKQQTEDVIFSIFPQELPILYLENEFKKVLRICDILLKIDPMFEPALIYSIYSYNRLNEFEKLFKIYAIFTSEYRKSMGQVYPKSLESLIQEA